MRILLVEDDAVIAERLKTGLQKERFTVDVARDGENGLAQALAEEYGVVILDVMLPKLDGWTICERLRNHKKTVPILMLTARDTVEDRIKGLETGADDYLPKPFDFRELLARINALTRRDRIHKGRLISIAGLHIDASAKTVTRDGDEIRLTSHEYDLLEALARNEGRTLTREIILSSVWGDSDIYSNVVDHHIASLRKKNRFRPLS